MQPKLFRRLNETAYRVLAGLREQTTPAGGGFAQGQAPQGGLGAGAVGSRGRGQAPRLTTRALSGGQQFPFEPSAEWLAAWQHFLNSGDLKAGMPEGLFPPDMVGAGGSEHDQWWSFIGWFSTQGLQQWINAGGQVPPGLGVSFGGGSPQSFEELIGQVASNGGTGSGHLFQQMMVEMFMFGQLSDVLGGGSVYSGNAIFAEMYEFFQFIFFGSGWNNPYHSQ